jgi:hypothetical protein
MPRGTHGEKAHPIDPVSRRIAMYEKVIEENACCDLCGGKNADGKIYQSTTFICLCEDCLKKLDAMPGTIKENIERYLMGNVI